MCIKINKYLKGYRNKYSVAYCFNDNNTIHLFDFDEKEIFNTSEIGNSSFYRSYLKMLLDEFKVFDNVQTQLNMERKFFERIIFEAVEDFYEHEFKNQFYKEQYRKYYQDQQAKEIIKEMIRYEDEFNETFNNEEHFKEWYINIINYNFNTEFTTYNEAKKYHESASKKNTKVNKNSNPYYLTKEEDELFQELLKEGFNKLAKKYHPDVKGDNNKMKLLNSLKEKLIK